VTCSFLLLATQRTGSTWVQETLNSHPELKVYSEMFLSYATGMPMWEPNDVEFASTYLEARVRAPSRLSRHYWTVRYLQRLFDQPSVRAVGFKCMYNQLRPNPAIAAYVACARVPVVHLIRRNLLDTLISARLAEARGVYQLATDGRPPIPWSPTEIREMKVRLEPDWTLDQLRRLSRERDSVRLALKLLRIPTCEVAYEDLADDNRGFDRVLGFLGVSGGVQLGSGLRKLNVRPPSEVVENVHELESALAATPFERFLRR
jgi:LPS sulfotransferase NodH